MAYALRRNWSHTIEEPPPCFTVGMSHEWWNHSFGNRRTKILLFVPNNSNFDSSVKRPFSQSSVIQWRCCLAYSRRDLICINTQKNSITSKSQRRRWRQEWTAVIYYSIFFRFLLKVRVEATIYSPVSPLNRLTSSVFDEFLLCRGIFFLKAIITF